MTPNDQKSPDARLNIFLAGLAALALGVTGCNTTRGVGQDIEAAGDAIEDAAEDASD